MQLSACVSANSLACGRPASRSWFARPAHCLHVRLTSTTRFSATQRPTPSEVGRPQVGCNPASGEELGTEHVHKDESSGDVFNTPAAVVGAVNKRKASTDLLGESTLGNLQLLEKKKTGGFVDVLGLDNVENILSMPFETVEDRVTKCIEELGVPAKYPEMKPQRAIFCNRTLNLRSIQVIGFDMDYTLIQYNVKAWEGKSYEYGIKTLAESGIPVDGLKFDPDLVCRGLIVDTKLGNLVKVDRFGLIKRAMHGERMLSTGDIRRSYGRELVNLRDDSRWIFLNTLFSVSEGCMYMQMVDRLDQGLIPGHLRIQSYQDMWSHVARALFQTHVESRLKTEIIEEPEKYVEVDPEMALALLDMVDAGKILLLVTNSDYAYTSKMMSFAYDRFMPKGQTWRDLFDMVIVQARKPSFWGEENLLYEIVTEDGLMRPAFKARKGGLYSGGSAKMVQQTLGLQGDSFLYVGDHIYTDAALAKLNFKWRTALIVRELEDEVEALANGRALRKELQELLLKKEAVGDLFNHLRVGLARAKAGRDTGFKSLESEAEVKDDLAQLLLVMDHLDKAISPLVEKDGSHFNERWGYLSIAGVNDKSQLTRQIEKYADIYTSRVSNFYRYTPYTYFRSPGQSLAHQLDLSEYYAMQQAMQQDDLTEDSMDAPELSNALRRGGQDDFDPDQEDGVYLQAW